jgi:hypothetical protein
MYNINDTTSDGIVAYLKAILVQLGLSINDCRGQCYDGANVMSGLRKGVATQILSVSLISSIYLSNA